MEFIFTLMQTRIFVHFHAFSRKKNLTPCSRALLEVVLKEEVLTFSGSGSYSDKDEVFNRKRHILHGFTISLHHQIVKIILLGLDIEVLL